MLNTHLYNEPLHNLSVPLSMVHYLLDGSYAVRSITANRIFVIGRDENGNQVFDEDEDSADIGLTGERLELQFSPQLPTSELAAQAAAGALAKARLKSRAGFIILPPNCGVELWDVIRVHDPLCAQSPRSYRVSGITLVYDSKTPYYYQCLFLSAV